MDESQATSSSEIHLAQVDLEGCLGVELSFQIVTGKKNKQNGINIVEVPKITKASNKKPGVSQRK